MKIYELMFKEDEKDLLLSGLQLLCGVTKTRKENCEILIDKIDKQVKIIDEDDRN